jgi:hypothetical protein
MNQFYHVQSVEHAFVRSCVGFPPYVLRHFEMQSIIVGLFVSTDAGCESVFNSGSEINL